MKYLTLLLIILIIPFTQALNVEVFNPESQAITNSHFRIEAPNYKTLLFVENNTLNIDLEQGPVLLVVDDLATLGADYIYEIEDADYEGKIHMLPAGTLRIKVYDSEGLIMPGAKVQILCSTVSYSDLETDDFGGIEKAVPAGQCEVFASKKSSQGSILVNVSQGEIVTGTQLVLDETVRGSEIILCFILVILLVGMIAVWLIVRRDSESSEDKTSEKKLVSRRSKDVFETLNNKEKKVVEFLKQGESYQNKIGRELGIPKTSLVRLLDSLENKKVISVEKIGKTKKIRLSGWFLGEKD